MNTKEIIVLLEAYKNDLEYIAYEENIDVSVNYDKCSVMIEALQIEELSK